jgi:hypothetical protein
MSKHLIQILVPAAGNDGRLFPEEIMREIQMELSERFGGITAYSRAPAKGTWSRDGEHQRDDIIVVEVMAQTLDLRWWTEFRRKLEKVLSQEQIVIRTIAIDII